MNAKADSHIYGVRSYIEWGHRINSADRHGIDDLSDVAYAPGSPELLESMTINNFTELMDLVAFLAVMNKNHTLLFRGQTCDISPLPSLLRARWAPPGEAQGITFDLNRARNHYWKQLELVGDLIYPVLRNEGLPRWRHMKYRSYARWAVIQHYELWPTPVLDFTTSLRIAASFAFGLKKHAAHGYLYIICTPRLRSDLMNLPSRVGDKPAESLLAFRLNSVCPPKARRPHLQDGALISSYPIDNPSDLMSTNNSLLSNLAAKVVLSNNGHFWSDEFPIHTEASLLPDVKQDELLQKLQSCIQFKLGAQDNWEVKT